MKKVLAIVLAVMMLATVAFAAPVNVVTPGQGNAGDNIATVELDTKFDAEKKYVLELADNVFDVFDSYYDKDHTSKFFKVDGVKGSFDDDTMKFQIPVDNTDRALDGKADLTINTIKVTALKANDTYAEFGAKDGKLVLKKLVLGGVDKTKDTKFDTDFYTAYDIGYKTVTDAKDFDANKDTECWFFFKEAQNLDVAKNVTLKVPAKTPFKLIPADGDASKIDSTKVPNNVTINTSTIDLDGYKILGGQKLTYKIAGDKNDYYYGVDAKGNLYASGMQFIVEKDVNGVESGYWTMTTDNARDMVKADGAIPGVGSAPAGGNNNGNNGGNNGGNTSNPNTGANDIVGVAAALAVVALVSGAAVSLKK